MRIYGWREHRFALVLLLLCTSWLPALSSAAVQPLFDLRAPATAPFPTDRYTDIDSRYLTSVRVTMPKPNCTARPSDCNDVDVLNTLDGFNLQPRLRIPFSGPINPSTVNSSSVFLVRINDLTRIESNPHRVIGINQTSWDPATNTLYAESEELLDQHTRYLLIVTNSVRDPNGLPLFGDDFWDFVTDPTFYRHGCSELSSYRLALIDALQEAGVSALRIVGASLFTTMSATAELEKMRDQIKAATPAKANFLIGNGGSRTLFPLSSVQGVSVARQTGTAPTFRNEVVPLPLLSAVPNALGSIAFGRYSSPNYMTTQQYIPAIASRSGTPVVQSTSSIYFMLMLPAGTKPAGGWPVALYGHGFGSNRETVMAFASVMASRGIATMAISVVGHGGGPLGTVTVNRTNGTVVTFPVGGRSIDLNADGIIDPTEGSLAPAPRSLIQTRDLMRQTVVDLMQLVRVIETGGIDADGDNSIDVNGQRIYYFGISLGGMYGPMLLAVDPSVRAGVPMVGGGTTIELARLGGFRGIPAAALANRTPSLLNLGTPAPPTFGFNENMPLRNQPLLTNTVAGANDIQEYFERWEWVSSAGDALSYAAHLRKAPLAGVPVKPVIIQMAKGDKTVPNPANTALVRAGNLADRVTYFRNDLAVAANSAMPKDPHPMAGGLAAATTAGFAIATQTQIAVFFASDGATFVDPDGAGPMFEAPIVGSLPEGLNFIP